ncbi:homoserine dehydrogenase [Neobacillus niacini]|uniref:homoserine dehydrogenase n=1 Tax=Neobacillus niacini TaxID=86668 RepID=UPI00285487E3|nr:homoserine dehydrogenase [Neobacillus niacini]MDR6998995.1 homoserine dehydrogenase [Neobacillus niacini]
MTVKVAILGFGTVGEGVYRTIQSHERELEALLGKKVEVAAVLIQNKQKERNIAKEVLITTDFNELINLSQLDIVVDAIVGKDPAFNYLKQAIERGCHIITANKEMFAHHGKELLALAGEHQVSVGFEATVAGGIPIIQTLRQLLKVNRVGQIQGIVNGTSNFILTEMREKKQSFADALKLAQERGFAEADPTNDVEGFDAFYKLMVLSRVAFGNEPDWKDVERVGITSITSELIEAADQFGFRFKHVVSIQKEGDKLIGSVRPVLIRKSHPFYHVEGVENALNVYSDIVGRITLQGPGAGMFPTASAVIEDLVYVSQSNHDKKLEAYSVTEAIPSSNGSFNDFWLISGLSKTELSPSIPLVEQLSDQTFIVETTKEEILRKAKEYSSLSYYPILDGTQTFQNKKECITVSI